MWCLNQYNPCVSKHNHPAQTREHTKIYLPTVSNLDTIRSRFRFIIDSNSVTELWSMLWIHFGVDA
jgi:hypothetical protein